MVATGFTRRTALKFGSIILLAASRRGLSNALTAVGQGYGPDPDLLRRAPTWSRTLSLQQLSTLRVLCDIVLPAEPPHPSAGAIGAHEFLDEWISAPYTQMNQDRVTILDGLAILDERSQSRWKVPFRELAEPMQSEVFEQICSDRTTRGFARRAIELISGGYYTTREGHAAIGYVGNVPLEVFPDPSPDVIRHFEELLAVPEDRRRTNR